MNRQMQKSSIALRGEVLSSWLTVSDYTQAELAVQLGVSRSRISQLMTAQEGLSANLIAKLIQLTRLPFHRLFLISDEKPASRVSNGTNGRKTKKKPMKPEHSTYVAPINSEGGELRHEVIAKS